MGAQQSDFLLISWHTLLVQPVSERKEYFDSPEVLEQKVDQLAAWVGESKHWIAFTVSTRYVHDEYLLLL